MGGLIVPLVMIVLTSVGGFLAFNLTKHTQRKQDSESNKAQVTANEFINVRDIREKYLYTRDNRVFMYIKINPISIDLLSEREKRELSRQLTAELSAETKPFTILAVSRPVDIAPLITEYTGLMATTSNQKRKALLRSEMMVMSNYALSGEVVERQFYLMIWDTCDKGNEKDLAKRAIELAQRFENVGIRSEVLNWQGIVRLCNLISNPAYSHMEDTSFDAALPLISDMYSE